MRHGRLPAPGGPREGFPRVYAERARPGFDVAVCGANQDAPDGDVGRCVGAEEDCFWGQGGAREVFLVDGFDYARQGVGDAVVDLGDAFARGGGDGDGDVGG